MEGFSSLSATKWELGTSTLIWGRDGRRQHRLWETGWPHNMWQQRGAAVGMAMSTVDEPWELPFLWYTFLLWPPGYQAASKRSGAKAISCPTGNLGAGAQRKTINTDLRNTVFLRDSPQKYLGRAAWYTAAIPVPWQEEALKQLQCNH